MTVLSLTRPAPRPLVVLTAASVALLMLTLLWASADPRLLDGVPVWAKPVKFALSFVVYFATLALVEARLSPGWREGRVMHLTVTVLTVAMLAEMGYIIAQAALGEASHFNFSTPYNAIMYGTVMAFGAILLVLGVAVIGEVVRRDAAADLGPGLRAGIFAGFVLTFVLTMITAMTLASLAGHHVGVPGPEARVIPLLGWSAAVGDLRPAHFLALHAMQVLPLAGLWIDRRGGRAVTVLWIALAYVLLTLAVFAQGLMGLPLIRL